MREGPIYRCPECREGDIFEIDTGLYTCTACHKTWTLEVFYPLLWFDQLMRLVKRRQRQKRRKSRVLSAEDIEKEIEITCNRIKNSSSLFLIWKTHWRQPITLLTATTLKTSKELWKLNNTDLKTLKKTLKSCIGSATN